MFRGKKAMPFSGLGRYAGYLVFFTMIALAMPAHAQLNPLSCGAAALRHDWDVNIWPAGSLSQSYTTNGETLDILISGDTNYFLPNSTSAPVTANYDTGGLSPAELSLELWLDFMIMSESISITFDIGTPGIGVEELQFSIFDVDFGDAQFQDQVTVVGYLNNVTVMPSLTAGSANSVNGNVALGQLESAETSSAANLGITFNDPIDKVILTYSNGPMAPDPPGAQAISIHDIFTCPRLLPDLIAQKTVESYDPFSTGTYNIPGAEVVYELSVTNVGQSSTAADSLFFKDSLPPEVIFFSGDYNGPSSGTAPIIFTQTHTSALSFNPSTDLGYSNAVTPPSSFSQCSYTPTGDYDPFVKHICLNPKGILEHGNPAPSVAFKFRTLIQ